MSLRPIPLVALVTACQLMAASGFLLGIDYSKEVDMSSGPLVTADGTGAVYVFAGILHKYNSASGLVWQARLGFTPMAIAADGSGNVWAVPGTSASGAAYVAKVNADGTMSGPTVTIGSGLIAEYVAVDTNSRVWVAGYTSAGADNTLATTPGAYQRTLQNTTENHCFLVRLNAAGTAIDYATYLAGSAMESPTGIAADGTGAVTIAGLTTSPDFPLTVAGTVGSAASFLVRLKPDGSGLVYSVLVGASPVPSGTVAVDAAGDASVTYLSAGSYTLTLAHYSPAGTLMFSRQGIAVGMVVGMDGAGDTFSTGPLATGNYPVKNSLTSCGGVFLTVFGPTGDVLQATWVSTSGVAPGIVVQPNSTAYVVWAAGSSSDAYVQVGVVARLSPNAEAATVGLACLTDAAQFQAPGGVAAGIAPGELVSLFGNGLGPAVGVQPSVTPASGYPKQSNTVQVLFDGQAASLLYVQDGQINAGAPWSLTAGATTTVCVAYDGVQTNCLTEPVVSAVPSIFTLDGSHAAAINQDGTINSADHPAPPGSIVAVYGTGFGAISPGVDDGAIIGLPLPVNVHPVTAKTEWVDGIFGSMVTPWDVRYYGPAPFEVGGVSQVNVQVPQTESTAVVVRNVSLQVASANTNFNIFLGNSH